MSINVAKKLKNYFSSSLAASTLLQFSIRITLVVLAVTAVSYWHVMSSLEMQVQDGLKNYISERGQKEREIFKLAEENHAVAKTYFSEYWKTKHDSDSLDYDRVFESFPDGTVRIPQKNFDGITRGDGSRSHDISGFIGMGAPIDSLEFRNRLTMSYWMISRFGEAWGSRFPNFYVTMPENVVIGYWPGLPWGLQAEANFDITKEEWFTVASQENNPGRGSVWTGLYYDHTVDEWMVSCITPVDIDEQHLINLGHDILLNSLFERTFKDKLEGTYNFIFREDGRLIAHPDKVEQLRKAAGQLYIRDVKDTALSSMHRQIVTALGEKPGEFFLLDDKENNNILAIASIPGPDWYFVTVYPKSLLTSVALDTARFILWLGLISLALEMLMLYLVFRKKVITPLNIFALASSEVAQGNYGLKSVSGMPLMLREENEVGLLARTFQKMAGDIQDYSEDLENKVAERTEKLQLATQEAKKADQAKSDFLARMSHEIRTPMNAVIGMTRLALKTPLNLQQRGYLDKIQISADLLMGIINDILDFSKIEAGKLELEKVPFNLYEVLDTLSHVISLKVESKGLELIYYMDPDVPERLIGDPLRLGQILINLANNAVKFTDEGEVIIAVGVDEKTDNHIRLSFSVKDTGIGISKEDADRLFTAFTQADGTVTRKYGGTGLGLAICKQLVEMMGGRIWLNSEPGVGSHFIFTVEFALVDEKTVSRRVPVDMKDLRILVVDDNESARNILTAELESFGMKVEQAESGREGIRMLEAASKAGKPYQLVLMDWKMPEMSGVEAARRIKGNSQLPAIPAILMVTSFAREEVAHLAEDSGLDGFLLKPVNASVLYDSIVSVISGGESSMLNKPLHQLPSASDMDLLKGARVLLVEDNSINREVALSYLEPTGVQVDTAENGAVAIEMLRTQPYSLVLMDIQMPEMDGLTATRIIRADSSLKDLPIVAMTAHAMSGDREKSLQAGMNDHISKPIDPDELQILLMKWIANQEHYTGKTELVAASDSESGPELPANLPGLDLVAASVRARNNNALLLKLLKNFYSNYQDLPQRLKTEILPEERYTEIQDLAHTIRPLAIYFGAHRLADAAKDVEYALSNKNQDAGQALQTFVFTLEEVLEGLEQLESASTEVRESAPRLINLEQARELITTIDELLRADDSSAEDLVSQLRACLPGAEYASLLEKLEYLIDDVEYAQAREVLVQLNATLDSVVP
ncbi:MAG: response regulator [Hahellaceae bacterium]|nr:response regulator [Hahellaceae bacterium]MCP5168197.1 response regulator [Hahellaceae bacterium]